MREPLALAFNRLRFTHYIYPKSKIQELAAVRKVEVIRPWAWAGSGKKEERTSLKVFSGQAERPGWNFAIICAVYPAGI
jgi:hypothetical protein